MDRSHSITAAKYQIFLLNLFYIMSNNTSCILAALRGAVKCFPCIIVFNFAQNLEIFKLYSVLLILGRFLAFSIDCSCYLVVVLSMFARSFCCQGLISLFLVFILCKYTSICIVIKYPSSMINEHNNSRETPSCVFTIFVAVDFPFLNNCTLLRESFALSLVLVYATGFVTANEKPKL